LRAGWAVDAFISSTTMVKSSGTPAAAAENRDCDSGRQETVLKRIAFEIPGSARDFGCGLSLRSRPAERLNLTFLLAKFTVF
jgi:hypothetical protein